MSTQVTQNAVMTAACQELVSHRLNIPTGQPLDLGQLRATLDAGRINLADMRSMAANAQLTGVLGRLAPTPFAKARAALAMPTTPTNAAVVTAAAHSALAEAVSTAGSLIAGATRDLTVQAFTEAAAELGYTHYTYRGLAATGIELRRDNDLLLLRVHDGGTVESDHMGIEGGACGDRQRELEAAVARRGITFTGRKQYNHGSRAGGDLIAAAARKDPSSLARATVFDAQQRAASPHGARLFSGKDAAPSHLDSQRRKGETA